MDITRGPHIVITGASSGLGAALACDFARDQSTLTLLGRNAGRLRDVAAACQLVGASVHTATADVADHDTMSAILSAADARQPIDILIANAGVGGSSVLAPLTGESGPLARQIFAVNTIGAINTITPILPNFVGRGRGHIVIISSLAAFEGLAESPVYSASKAGLRVYGHGLRRLLRGSGVSVTIVSAGFVNTPMAASLPFRTPFIINTDAAARIIRRGIDRRSKELIFPWQLRSIAALGQLLPTSGVDAILRLAKRWSTPS